MNRLGLLSGVLALGIAGLVACGSDDDDTPGSDDSDNVTGPEEPVDAELDATVERVGSSLRIAWTVTNNSGEELVVFDNRRPDETGDTERYGSYVVGRDDGSVEISRRLFPVPEDLEGVQAYGVTASLLAAESEASGREIVLLPPEYAPAAPEGGGDPLPDDPEEAVFCLGVAPADEFPASASESAPEGYRFAQHSPGNVGLQTVLCSDPFEL